MTPALPAFTSESDLRIDPSAPFVESESLEPRKSTVTTGDPANDGAEEPSIVTVSVIDGSEARPTRIVPATPKSMVSAPGLSLDWTIARRSEPAPEGIEARHRERGQELPAFQDLDAADPRMHGRSTA